MAVNSTCLMYVRMFGSSNDLLPQSCLFTIAVIASYGYELFQNPNHSENRTLS